MAGVAASCGFMSVDCATTLGSIFTLEDDMRKEPVTKLAQENSTNSYFTVKHPNGAIIDVTSLSASIPMVDRLAPEHLEIISTDADDLTMRITNAGAIFIGGYTPEAIGDYVGGSNHVLPTARSARFSSGLGVNDFVKRTSLLKCSPDSLRVLGPAAVALGEAEGLHAHARSVSIRMNLG
jgi:histidinol dehydrogenase